MKFFIIIKEKSERLRDKNFLNLGGKPLFKHLLDELDYPKNGQDIFIDTDSEKILSDLKNSNINCYKRKQESINLENNSNFKVSPVLLMIENFLDNYVEDENDYHYEKLINLD